MVGPGTGCAPFRSFIQERITNLTEVLHNPSNILFFGCRSETKDFFCHEEWLPLIKNNQLQLFTAFSRDQVFSWQHKANYFIVIVCCWLTCMLCEGAQNLCPTANN
jgi:sulfite reductase alpha subunit-like flavoprotein